MIFQEWKFSEWVLSPNRSAASTLRLLTISRISNIGYILTTTNNMLPKKAMAIVTAMVNIRKLRAKQKRAASRETTGHVKISKIQSLVPLVLKDDFVVRKKNSLGALESGKCKQKF